MKKIILIIAVFFSVHNMKAQTTQDHTGWFLYLNSLKFNNKWGMHFDFQVRSNNDWKHIRSVLIRPGITYYIKPNQNASVGYLYTPTYTQSTTGTNTTTEHRIWEQYIISHPVASGFLSHRFRLEQRFLYRGEDKRAFAQRFRYFFRDVQPIKKPNGAFTKGPFVALQNELFFNVHNKENTNNHFFDQNRAYIAAGVRFSKKCDLEAGYMNQFIKGTSTKTMNHIAQLALYTRF